MKLLKEAVHLERAFRQEQSLVICLIQTYGGELGISYLIGNKIESKNESISENRLIIVHIIMNLIVRQNVEIYTCPQNYCRQWEY